jgi:hypothetical protein
MIYYYRVRIVPIACLHALASVAPCDAATEEPLPHIPKPDALAIEMAKALVSNDRERFTALVATREEMETLGG